MPAKARRKAPLILPDTSICNPDLFDARYRRQKDVGSRPNSSDQRTGTEKDKDRIAYSGYFQRLAGVTQVVSPHLEAVYLHNRQSHSFKVSLVAEEIARDLVRKAGNDQRLLDDLMALGGLDVAACAAAGLAHDIGHPPFGHVSEVRLSEYLTPNRPDRSNTGAEQAKPDSEKQEAPADDKKGDSKDGYTLLNGFEGNAQSLRVVASLDRRRSTPERGLNLTCVTLCAILKYPWTRVVGDPKREKKYGAYADEAGALEAARSSLPRDYGELRQSAEAAIMDLADDVTYAMHDLEDFYLAGVLHKVDIIDELDAAKKMFDTNRLDENNVFIQQCQDLSEHYPGFFKESLYVEALVHAQTFLGRLSNRHTGSPTVVGTTRQWVSDRIGEFLSGVEVSREPKWEHGPPVYLEEYAWHDVQVMKNISKRFIVQTPKVSMHERSQLGVLDTLLECLTDWVRSTKGYGHSLVEPLRSFLGYGHADDPNWQRRAIADYICSLSDSECLRLARILDGVELYRL